MSTETKKPWDKTPIRISTREWQAKNAAAVAVREEGADLLRKQICEKLADLIGRSDDKVKQSIGIVTTLIQRGYLQKPDWHEKLTLTLGVIPIEELAEAYTNLKNGTAPEREDHDEENPF